MVKAYLRYEHTLCFGIVASTSARDADDTIIEFRGVSKSFGSKQVLRDVSFTIRRGEAVGIIGPSGTGKSTVLRLICGLIAPDRGGAGGCTNM